MRTWMSRLFLIYGLLVFLPLMLVLAPLAGLAVVLGGEERGPRWAYHVLRFWALAMSLPCAIVFRTDGRDRIANTPVGIFVLNHRSYYDGVAVFRAIDRPFKPLGKKELARVPWFGFMYRRVSVIVDRKDPESRRRSLDELRRCLRSGISIVMFPEGTTNRSAEPLLPFRDGAFRLAIETGTPVIPVAVDGTARIFPRHDMTQLHPGAVRVRFGSPIHTAGLKEDQLSEVKRQAELQIRTMLGELAGTRG